MLAVLLLAAPAPAGSKHPPQQTSPLPPLPAVHAELEGLEGAAFQARVEELLQAPDRTVVLDALVLRAGRQAPPGLSGSRAERRDARRREARAWMGTDDRWIARARDLVAAPGTDEDLRCAALIALGDGGQLRVAPDLAWALDEDRFSPRVCECARDALLQLTGRRFRSTDSFGEASAGWSARTRAGIFADELLAQEQRIEQLEIALLEGDDARLIEALQTGTPALRGAAAAIVGRGVGRQGRTLDGALAALFGRLEVEHHPRVLHATLTALVGLLEGLDPTAEPVQRARALLTTGPLAGRRELAPTITDALARLPGDEAALSAAAARVSALVADLADEERPVDYEALSLGLDALEELLGREAASAVDPRGLAPAGAVVLDLLERPAVPLQVRLDAADAAGRVLSVDSFGELLDALEGAGSERLQLDLLASVARLGRELDPAAPAAVRLLEALEGLVAAPGADLRLRAIEVLRGEELSELHPRARAEGMPGRLVERLALEGTPAVRDALLDTLADLGPAPEQALALVSLDGFDALLDENHRRCQRMARCLRALAGEDADAALLGARRLARDQRGTLPVTAPAPVDRLRAALTVAVGPGQETVVAWPAADHRLALDWALELLAAGASPELVVLERVITVHLVHATELGPIDVLRLLVARDLRRHADGSERDVAEVEASFERTLAEAEVGEARDALLLRARWRMDSGDAEASVADWDELLFPLGNEEPRAGFETADLRRARVAYAGDPVRAARVGLGLVDATGWADLDPGVRLADLLAMADLAVASGEADLQRIATRRLQGVPAPAEGEALPTFAAGAAWSGTLLERDDHEALWRRAEALRAALTPPDEAEESDDGDGGDGGDDGDDGDGGDGGDGGDPVPVEDPQQAGDGG